MSVNISVPPRRAKASHPALRLRCTLLLSLSLACITQQNRRFLAAYPVDGRGTWSVATEVPGAAMTDGEGKPLEGTRRGDAIVFPAPEDGRILLTG